MYKTTLLKCILENSWLHNHYSNCFSMLALYIYTKRTVVPVDRTLFVGRDYTKNKYLL